VIKLNFAPGAIISIPCDKSYVVAKVLYVSEYFKNTALLKIYSHRLPIDGSYINAISEDSFELVHTGVDLIKKGRWAVLTHIPLSDSESQSLKRVVGGDVWDADNCLGAASDADLSALPKMNVFNVKAVEGKATKYPLI
jgi:hypothetical protein